MTSPSTAPAASPAKTLRLRAALCGRDREIALLEGALFDVLGNRTPHTIALIGGAGMGKSRLVREFLADMRVRHDDLRVLASQCREGGDAYGVIRALLRSRFGLTESMDAETSARTLHDAVCDVIGDRRVSEFVHFLGAFLDMHLPDSPLSQAMTDDPEQVRQLGRSVLRRFLELDAGKQPLIISLDDFHLAHADAASLVHYLVRTLSGAPVLFVISARPELLDTHPEWLDLGGSAIRFDLAPLEADHAATMVELLLAPTGDPPEELIDEAVELAAGNPYLIEQIVRTFIDQRVIIPRTPTQWDVDLARLPEVQLPLSVDDAIQARISGLSAEERNLLEMAAALGGVFWLGALVALARTQTTPPRLFNDPKSDRKRLLAVLDELATRDYVMRLPDASIPGEIEYAFKHNLEREALIRYTSRLLLVRHHRVIAQWLELRQGESSEEQHEFLAQHFELGGVNARAAHHYLQAGDRARLRYAAARSAAYYARGLKLLGEGEASVRLRSLERWGEMLQLCGQSEAAFSAFEEMRSLAYQLDLPALAALAHTRIGQLQRELGKLDAAIEHFDTAQALYESAGDARGEATTQNAMATIHLLRGNADAAEHLVRDAIRTFDKLRDEPALARARLSMGIVHRHASRMEAAQEEFALALALQRKTGDEAGAAETLMQLGVLHDRSGDQAQALSLWNEALTTAQRLGDRVREAALLTCLGGAAYRRGAPEEAVTKLSQAVALARALGDRLQEADATRSLAKAYALSGDHAAAAGSIARAVQVFEQAQSLSQLSVALRTQAEIAASADDADASGLFDRAVALHEELHQEAELARTLMAYADHVGKGSAQLADGKERALRAERLRERSRELLARHKGLTLRASFVPSLPKKA